MPGLEDIMNEAEREVRSFAAANVLKRTGTGVPPAPKIEVEETVLKSTPMELQLDKPADRAEGGGPGGPPPPPNRTGACCRGTTCTIESEAHCTSSGGGTYKGDGTGCDPNPCTMGACCYCIGTGYIQCAMHTLAECDSLYGEFMGLGTSCATNPCNTSQRCGACCLPGQVTCVTHPMSRCNALGGTYYGDGYSCTPYNPCDIGACCHQHSQTCSVEWFYDCANTWNGHYQGFGTVCSPNPCPPVGACCVGTTCSVETAADCGTMGGIYKGDGFTCSANPCIPQCPEASQPTPSLITASVSGLTTCTDCTLAGDLTSYLKWTITLPSSFTLPYNVGLGGWYTTIPNAATMHRWTTGHPSCDGPSTDTQMTATAFFGCAGPPTNQIEFYVNFSPSASSIFNATNPPLDPLTWPPLTMPNDWTTCVGGGSSGAIATGGVATISW